MLRDPGCGQRIHRNRAYAWIEHQYFVHYLCCPRCQTELETDAGNYNGCGE